MLNNNSVRIIHTVSPIFSFQKDQILSNLDATLTYENFRKCDMVIEAVYEDINIKHKVIKEVEKVS